MKYHFIQQHGEEDCGAACLASIARHHGLKMSLRRIRELVGTGQQGTNLWGLQQGANKLGFNTRPVKISLDVLNRIHEVPLPALIHWKGNHWVVLYGKQGNCFVVVDPGIGVRRLSAKELAEGWTDWVMLLLEPDAARFSTQSDEPAVGFGRFFQRVWSYRALLSQAIVLNLIVGLLSIASPILLQILTDDVLVRGDFKLLNTMVMIVMVMTLISNGLSFVQSNLIAHFAQRLELGLILEFCQQILRLPLAYYEARRSGEIISRLHDIQQINYLVSQLVVNLPSQIFIAAISLGLMLFYNWKLTILGVAIAAAMGISVIIFQPSLQRQTQSLMVTDAANQGVLVETFKGALTLKTMGAMPRLWEELQGRFTRLVNLNLRTNQIAIMNNSFSGLVASIGGIGLLWFGGNLVISPTENLSVGQLLAFKALNDNLLHLVSTLVNFADEVTRAKAAVQRLAEVTTETPEDQDDRQKADAAIAPDADLACNNLSFDYPGRTDLLENFSIQIPGGQVTALMGQSGCGKSTVAKLLAGLYPIKTGNIRIGLYNQQDLSLESLRRQVVLVPQDAHFWNRTIIENFRLSASTATFEQIVRACQIAGADEFISKLPNKYQTVLGEFATNLSGGQRQRLAIARALVNNPPILILDEATSGLDPASETEVMDRLLHERRGKTTILISHRAALIQRANWIVVLEQGQLKLQGSRSELLNTGTLESLYSIDSEVRS